MTVHELKQYHILKNYQKDLEKRISDEKMKSSESVAGVVTGSAKNFPYTERRYTVMMEDPADAVRRRARIAGWETEKQICARKITEIQDFIEEIPDMQLRLILRAYIVDGNRQIQIARKLHMDQSRISRKMSAFFRELDEMSNLEVQSIPEHKIKPTESVVGACCSKV